MKSLVNVGIFTQSLSAGGAEKQAVYASIALSEKYNVFIITINKNLVSKNLQSQLTPYKNITLINLPKNKIRLFFSLIKVLKKNNIKVLINYLLFPSLFGGIAARFIGIKSIGGIRSSLLEGKKKIFNKICQNHINHLTVYNNFTGIRKYSKIGFIETKAVVIPNAIKFRQEIYERKETNRIHILSVGRFDHSKDYYTALKSIHYLDNKKINFEYTIVGYGELENNIRTWIQELNLFERVRIIISPNNLDDYYKKADIFLQTSIFEGLSNTILEAMSWSLPLVITNVGDAIRLVDEGQNGFLCEIGNVTQIAEKLDYLIKNYEIRNSFGKRSFEKVKISYGFESFQKSYLNLVNSIINV